ncbi:hypothetical protein [Nocardiopsis sp. CC223A]|uniref:hypothetical protein n=1 Tax=Nocardiopsis sp. CC223A TaxID=3044051 RepID=UPI00278BFCAB|nr:hypothetical protein [Nocardiopsis sp. CC223A]
MSHDATGAWSDGRPEPQAAYLTAGLLFLFLGAAGFGIVLHLLLGPPSLETETHGTVACISTLGENSAYEEDNEEISSEWRSKQEDACEELRRERMGTALIVTAPTAISGSIGSTFLLLRRHQKILNKIEADRNNKNERSHEGQE